MINLLPTDEQWNIFKNFALKNGDLIWDSYRAGNPICANIVKLIRYMPEETDPIYDSWKINLSMNVAWLIFVLSDAQPAASADDANGGGR